MSENDELPEGWALASLGDLAVLINGDRGPNYPNKSALVEKGVPFINAGHIKDGGIDLTEMNYITDERFDLLRSGKVQRNDILYCLRGSLGKTAVVKDIERGAIASSLVIIRASEDFELGYLFNFLVSPAGKDEILKYDNGSAQPNLAGNSVAEFSVPLPPLTEQQRIVAKVETLLARVNAARQRLARVPALLKRFRQSVLAAACSGQLTEDWRENELSVEPAASLRDRIRSAKKKGYVAPNRDAETEFPDSWELVSMDEITSIITSGSRDWKQYYTDDGPGTFIMAQNVRPMKLDRSYRLGVRPPEGDRDRVRSQVQKDDVLVTIVGANTGDVCRVPEELDQHYVCQSVALMRPILQDTSAYVEMFLNSPRHGKEQYEDWIYGEGRPHISFDHLRATAIGLPPLAEQHEIVRRVEALLARADRIEKRLATATRRVETLTQAILAKAFCGELVPTEAELARKEGRDYEPAEVLLQRIRAERDAAGTTKKKAPRGERGRSGSKSTSRSTH